MLLQNCLSLSLKMLYHLIPFIIACTSLPSLINQDSVGCVQPICRDGMYHIICKFRENFIKNAFLRFLALLRIYFLQVLRIQQVFDFCLELPIETI